MRQCRRCRRPPPRRPSSRAALVPCIFESSFLFGSFWVKSGWKCYCGDLRQSLLLGLWFIDRSIWYLEREATSALVLIENDHRRRRFILTSPAPFVVCSPALVAAVAHRKWPKPCLCLCCCNFLYSDSMYRGLLHCPVCDDSVRKLCTFSLSLLPVSTVYS